MGEEACGIAVFAAILIFHALARGSSVMFERYGVVCHAWEDVTDGGWMLIGRHWEILSTSECE